MRILFDNGTPAPLRRALRGHIVVEGLDRGWEKLSNGELLAAAEAAGFDVLVTTDKNLRYQQNIQNRRIAVVVLGNQRWPVLKHYVDRVTSAVELSVAGSYTEVQIPLTPPPGL